MGKHDEALVSAMIEAGGVDKATLEVWAERNIQKKAIDVTLVNVGVSSGKAYQYVFAQPLVEISDGDLKPSPTMSLKYEAAEKLMTAMWYCGIRPTGVGGTGELAALQKQLEAQNHTIAYERNRSDKMLDLMITEFHNLMGGTK